MYLGQSQHCGWRVLTQSGMDSNQRCNDNLTLVADEHSSIELGIED